MNKKLLLILALALILFEVPTYAAYDNYGEKFNDVIELIDSDYYDKEAVNKDELFEIAVESMLKSLDPYSAYMKDSDLKDFINKVNNHYEGIGVVMSVVNAEVEVKEIAKNGPAFKAGVKMHDIFRTVDGVDVKGMAPLEIANIVRGQKGTTVRIDFQRNGKIISKEILREEVVVEAASEKNISELIPELEADKAAKIGYISIDTFSEDVHKKVGEIMSKFEEEGKNNIIVDLRENGGGEIFSGVKTAEYFTDKGPVLVLKDNNGGKREYLGAGKKGDKNIVMIINENTASASEFVAGSAKEDGVKIVGATSYGKGVAQTLNALEDGDTVKLSVYSFYTGEGEPIHELGVVPDYVVNTPELINTEFKFHTNDVYEDVLALENGLKYLGYELVPDNKYDENTASIISQIQEKNGLYAYGVFDHSTQKLVNQLMKEKYNENDEQLKKALEVLLEEMK